MSSPPTPHALARSKPGAEMLQPRAGDPVCRLEVLWGDTDYRD